MRDPHGTCFCVLLLCQSSEPEIEREALPVFSGKVKLTFLTFVGPSDVDVLFGSGRSLLVSTFFMCHVVRFVCYFSPLLPLENKLTGSLLGVFLAEGLDLVRRPLCFVKTVHLSRDLCRISPAWRHAHHRADPWIPGLSPLPQALHTVFTLLSPSIRCDIYGVKLGIPGRTRRSWLHPVNQTMLIHPSSSGSFYFNYF